MSHKSRSAVWIAIVAFLAIAIALKVFGGPLYKALLAMHGKH